jgi:hypothetical protein
MSDHAGILVGLGNERHEMGMADDKEKKRRSGRGESMRTTILPAIAHPVLPSIPHPNPPPMAAKLPVLGSTSATSAKMAGASLR